MYFERKSNFCYFFFQGPVSSNSNIKTSKSAAYGFVITFFVVFLSLAVVHYWSNGVAAFFVRRPCSFFFFSSLISQGCCCCFRSLIQFNIWPGPRSLLLPALVHPSIRPCVRSSFVAVCIFNEKLNKKKKRKRNMKLWERKLIKMENCCLKESFLLRLLVCTRRWRRRRRQEGSARGRLHGAVGGS